jgi:predicted metal-dependent phosphoesterase TrpH
MKQIRIDMHMHSSASFDCKVEPAAVAQRCRALGLSPIVLTDHGTISGALELWRDDPDRVIIGQEIATTDGEIIALFVEQEIPEGLPADETVLRIKAQGALVYLEHAYDPFRRPLSEAAIERLGDRIDIVEVFNGRSPQTANEKAADLCEILGAAPGAGSDAHRLDEIGSANVELAPFRDAKELLKNLRESRIVRRPSRLRMTGEALLRSRIRRS